MFKVGDKVIWECIDIQMPGVLMAQRSDSAWSFVPDEDDGLGPSLVFENELVKLA